MNVSEWNRPGMSAKYILGNLLAILNRDGGHYQREYGLNAAVEYAIALHHVSISRIETLIVKNAHLMMENKKLIRALSAVMSDWEVQKSDSSQFNSGWDEYETKYQSARNALRLVSEALAAVESNGVQSW